MFCVRWVRAAFLAVSTLIAALGLFLLIWPELAAEAICVLLGGMAVVFGVIKLMGYFSNDLYRLAFQFDLAAGILTILVGLLLLLHPWDVLALLPVVVGLFILADSALRLQTAMDARHFGMGKWWMILAAAAGGIVLGAVLVLRPFSSAQLLIRLMGLTLLLDGVENLLAGLYTIKVPRRSGAQPGGGHTTFER